MTLENTVYNGRDKIQFKSEKLKKKKNEIKIIIE